LPEQEKAHMRVLNNEECVYIHSQDVAEYIKSLASTEETDSRTRLEKASEEIRRISIDGVVSIPPISDRYQRMLDVATNYYKALQEGRDSKEIKRLLDESIEPFSDDPAYCALLRMTREANNV